jgi:hypothetical protein
MLIARRESKSKGPSLAQRRFCVRVGNAGGSERATEWWGPTHWWTEVFLKVDNDERGFDGFV